MQLLVDVIGGRSARLLVMNREADVVEQSLKVGIDDQYISNMSIILSTLSLAY